MNQTLKNIIVAMVHGSGSLLRPLLRGAGYIRREPPPAAAVRTILVIALHHIGDILFVSPVIRALRYQYPDARLCMWVKSRTREIAARIPGIDEVIVFDGVCTDWTREKFGSRRERRIFVEQLKDYRLDLLVDCTGVLGTLRIGMASQAAFRIGFNSQGLGFLFDREPVGKQGRHLVRRYASVVETIGVCPRDESLSLDVSKNDITQARRFLETGGVFRGERFVCIHPAAGWRTKCWPPERFALLADELISRCGVKVVLCGGGEDLHTAHTIRELMRGHPVNAVGTLNLGTAAALIKECALFVGHDSGPAYMADAVGVPVIILFGPTNPAFSAPRSARARVIWKQGPCSARQGMQHCHNQAAYPCKNIVCMRAISVEEVFVTAVQLLGPERANPYTPKSESGEIRDY